MTGSGGFTPGSPVSTHKKIWYKRDGFTAGTPLSIHQKNKIILLDFRFSFQ